MSAIEPEVRAFCGERLDELVGCDSFDFATDFVQYVPMQVFGMLLGLPGEEQERVRAYVERALDADRASRNSTAPSSRWPRSAPSTSTNEL